MILFEEKFNSVQPLIESANGEKKLFMKGIFAESEERNQNGRIYDLNEMKLEVARINEAASQGRYVLGELDHPSTLEIKLENVSHKIVEMWMEGTKAYGKAEVIVGHPKGQILKSLIESGVRVGVSTRGSGQVNESTGRVTNFRMVTVDAVATPSARNAFPETLEEQLQYYRRGAVISDLSEAVIHDQAAQMYFKSEMDKFIQNVLLKK
jgi:hypothetical protein